MLCKGKVVSSLINRVTLSRYCGVGQGNQTTKASISIVRNYMNNQSLRLGKAKQLCLTFSQEKKGSCLSGTRTRDVLHTRQML